MNKVKVDFAEWNLFLNFIIIVFFVNDPSEGLLYLLTRLHDLPLHHSIVYPSILLYLDEYRILLIDPLQVPVLDLPEDSFPGAVYSLALLELPLLNVHDLSYVKHVLHSGLHISHELLRDLYLLVNCLGRQKVGRWEQVIIVLLLLISVLWCRICCCLNYELLFTLLISAQSINSRLLLYRRYWHLYLAARSHIRCVWTPIIVLGRNSIRGQVLRRPLLETTLWLWIRNLANGHTHTWKCDWLIYSW